jgi:hypothetical protein
VARRAEAKAAKWVGKEREKEKQKKEEFREWEKEKDREREKERKKTYIEDEYYFCADF